MRVLLVIMLVLAIIAETAEARKRRHHRHCGHGNAYAQAAPSAASRADQFTGRIDRRSTIAGLIPRDWQLEPADDSWQGRRFVSPTGTAWLALYARSAADESREERFRAIAFVEDEEVTYLRGERDWLAVSGFRGDQIFYRKMVLACGERQWRHVAFEYPAKEKRKFDQLVGRMSRALDRARDEDCRPASPKTEAAPAVE